MKRLLITVMTFLLLGMGTTWADLLEDATAAYRRGDYRNALKIIRRLAEQGNAPGQANLGVMYANGQGVAQNYAEALKWYRLAAAQGNAIAQSNLGAMYANGQSVAQDYAEALKWFRLAAAQGDASAQNSLGFMYANALGIAQDYVRAHMWFNLGAESGFTTALASRDLTSTRMTPQQVALAKQMAIDCQRRNFKGCD